jgi:hypothetical protein
MAVERRWVEVNDVDRVELATWLRALTMPQGLAMRARIVLDSAHGESIRALADWWG